MTQHTGPATTATQQCQFYEYQFRRGVPTNVGLLATFFLLTVCAQISVAQTFSKDRIAQSFDSSQMSTVEANVHPQARAQFDQGKVDPTLKLERITIVFRPTADQQAKLDALLAGQENASSSNFHKWLTPEQYADRFGVTQNDANKVAAWLQAQGFNVVETARSRNWIAFNGTAEQVEGAFHTEIHKYIANGKSFYANNSDPSVPSAFAGIVLGFRSLNNFPMKPRGIKSKRANSSAQSNFTSSISGNHFLTPDDFATIYDLKPLYNSSPALDGTGQKIAVVGQSNIVASDIATFRSLSGLSVRAPTITLVPGSTDPGVVDGDVQEASLDIEWSGAVARNATIIYVYSGDVFTSLQYAIDQNLAPVISVSYGTCESLWTTSGIASLVALVQQANSQGITVVAASGDGGAADCDGDAGNYPATEGLTVDVPASLPYVTGMGGTEFNEGNGAYWNTANNTSNGSALSYIPEAAWNDSSSTNGLSATGGGRSILFAKPTWQTGSAVPADGMRDVPDISLAASPGHDGYLVCTQITGSSGLTSGCKSGFRASATDTSLTVYGGTSFGAPTFAGILALINQKTNSTGQGNVNYVLYPLAASAPSAFHDITTGINGYSGNEVPCTEGATDCPGGGNIGYSAATGYDLATGLGTIDAYNMVTMWSSVPVSSGTTPTLTSISPVTAAAGAADFTLTATGSSFASNAQILWNGSTSGVTMQSGGTTMSIKATISHTLVAYGTVASVTVTNQSATAGGSAAQTFTVTAGAPANDNFANAIVVSSNPFTSTVDNSGATTETADPSPACASQSTNPRTKTVWWSFTAGAAGTLTADTIGSAYDTTLSVWTGAPGSFTSVACNDDIVAGQNRQSRVTFTTASGTKYYFMVAPFGPPDTGSDLLGGKTVLNVSGVNPSSFSVSPSSVTVNAGSAANYQITNSSSKTYVVTCSGLPTGAACGAITVNPNANASLTISTASRGSSPPFSVPLWPISARRNESLLVLLSISTIALLFTKRCLGRASICFTITIVALLFLASGCGGSSSGTPAGTYTIVVTGTSGTDTASNTVILKVT